MNKIVINRSISFRIDFYCFELLSCTKTSIAWSRSDSKDAFELYAFGENFGDGSDSSHFQLGLTSKKIMSKFELNGMFHIDATYKIIKYNYPLIILGITDMERRFHPICYMFTSHEQEVDYDHFFDSLLVECKCLGLRFEPTKKKTTQIQRRKYKRRRIAACC